MINEASRWKAISLSFVFNLHFEFDRLASGRLLCAVLRPVSRLDSLRSGRRPAKGNLRKEAKNVQPRTTLELVPGLSSVRVFALVAVRVAVQPNGTQPNFTTTKKTGLDAR